MWKTNCSFLLKIIIQILIFSLVLIIVSTKRIDVETISCPHNFSEMLGGVGCSVKRHHDNITKVSMFIKLNKKLDNFEVRHILEFSRYKMGRFKFLDLRVNGCDFLKAVHKNKIVNIFKQNLEKALNILPRKCPVPGPFNYNFTDYFMDVKYMPNNFPSTDFRASFFAFYEKRLVLTIISTGKIIN